MITAVSPKTSLSEAGFMKEILVLDHDNDTCAIPFLEAQRLFDRLPFGDPIRVMCRVMLYTGCRGRELNRMMRSSMHEGWIFWELGKNQTGNTRHEKLPADLLAEIVDYRGTHRIAGDKLFGITYETMARYFNRDVRPLLGGQWTQKALCKKKGKFAWKHRLQLRGFRKTFQTYLFWQYYQKYKDAGFAVECVSKRMKHHSKQITAYHYIQNFEVLGILDYELNIPIEDVLQGRSQLRIDEFV